MKRQIVESMSMEEAFKSLNAENRSRRKLTETVLYDRKPTYYRDKLTRDDSFEHTFNKIIQSPLSDALNRFEVTSVSDPNFEKCIDEVVNNLGIISDCDITHKMILKAKVRELGEYLLRSENESLTESAEDTVPLSLYFNYMNVEDPHANADMIYEIVKEGRNWKYIDARDDSAIGNYKSAYEAIVAAIDAEYEMLKEQEENPEDYGLSENEDDLHVVLSVDQTSTISDSELTAIKAKIDLFAEFFTIRKVEFTLETDRSENESLTESVDPDDTVIAVPAEQFGYPEFFADDVENFGDVEETVANYYAARNTSRADLIAKTYYVSNPKYLVDDEGNPCEASVDELIEDGVIEDFGFQIANGDYLYTRLCHDTGAAYVKCRDYASMINYVKNGYEPDSWNVDDLIEN